MKERPIIMTNESPAAILAGRKTQTRRVVKDVPEWVIGAKYDEYDCDGLPWLFYGEGKYSGWYRCPYGEPGDRLWVKESWAQPVTPPFGAAPIYALKKNSIIRFEADGKFSNFQGEFYDKWKIRASIFMPRRLSRITLEILNIRVERVQEISEEDCIAEGCGLRAWGYDPETGEPNGPQTAGYAELWDTLNAKRGYPWADNPWVWVIDFKVLP